MKNQSIKGLFVLALFVILSLLFFRQYVFSSQVPLPFNLLASFYAPWKFETWKGYETGVPNKPLGFDNIKLFYPYRKFTTDELAARRIPLWNPYVFSGNVHVATYQSAVFYPLSVIYLWLSLVDAWSVLVLVQPILAGWFTFLFLRSLRLSDSASLFGAIGFAFSGWMMAMWQEVLVMEHALLWLPLALYGTNKIWEKRYLIGVLWTTVAISMSILAGFLQMSLYLMIILFSWTTYLFFRERQNQKTQIKSILFVALSVLLAGLISAVQWMPALESYLLSPRGQVNAAFIFRDFLTPIYFLVTLVVPDFWGNPGTYNYFSPVRYIQERTIFVSIFVFIFFLSELIGRQKGERRFWKITTIIAFSLGLTLPTSWIWYVLKIPILSAAQPARVFAISTFGICVMAAYGLEEFLKSKDRKKLIRPIVFVGVMLLLASLFVAGMLLLQRYYSPLATVCGAGTSPWITRMLCWAPRVFDPKLVSLYATVSLRNLFLPWGFALAAILSIWLFARKKFLFLIVVYGVSIISSLYIAQKILYFSDRLFEYPVTEPIMRLRKLAGLHRIWSYGEAHMIRNISSYFSLYSPEGYDALYSYQYGELMHSIQTKGVMEGEIYRTDAILGEAGQAEAMTNPYRLRMMSLLSVKYILEKKIQDDRFLTTEERFPPELFTTAWENETWRIWEYKHALPRTFVATSFMVETDKKKAAAALYSDAFSLTSTLILDSNPDVQVIGKEKKLHGENSASIQIYEPTRVVIDAQSISGGYVFLSDTYYPGWVAKVDGKEAPIYRANIAFRAVPISAGKHVVTFEYKPLWFRVGVYTTLLGVSGLLIVLVRFLRHYRKKN